MNAGERTTLYIPIGQALTVTPSGGGQARVYEISSAGVPATPVLVSGSAQTFGPYNAVKAMAVEVLVSTIAIALALPDPSLNATDAEVAAAYQPLNTDVGLGNGLKIITGAGVPVDGGSGTGAGVAEKGSLYLDKTNGKAYINGGTLASPIWKLITSAV